MATAYNTFNLEEKDIHLKFVIPSEITECELEIEYRITNAYKGSMFEPAEYPELEIENVNVITIFTTSGKFTPSNKQRDYLVSLVNKESNRLEEQVWEYDSAKNYEDSFNAEVSFYRW
jgi:hypothetical protein